MKRQAIATNQLILTLFLCLLLAACTTKAPNETQTELQETAIPDVTPTKTAIPTQTPILVSLDEDLAAVIAAADDGAVLQLEEGTYPLMEGIVITKSITLIGAGMDKTIITGSKTVTYLDEKIAMVHFDLESGSLDLQDLTLSYGGTDPSHVLRINNGTFHMSGSRLEGAVPYEDGKRTYDLVMANSTVATVENNVFEGGTVITQETISGGVTAQGSTQLDFAHNTLNDSTVGLICTDSAVCDLTGNTFSSIAVQAISYFGESSGTATENTIKGGDFGLFAMGTSNVSVTGNTFSDIRTTAIVFTEDSNGTATNNTIRDSQYGVSAAGNSKAVFDGNIFSGIRQSAASFLENSTVTVRENEVKGTGDSQGMACRSNAACTFEDNTVSACTFGIFFVDASTGSAKLNHIDQVVEVGLYASGTASPIFEGNTLTGQPDSEDTIGIMFTDDAISQSTANTMSNFYRGLYVEGNANVQVEENVIEDCEYGIMAYGTSIMNAINNTLTHNVNGIYLQDDSSGTFENNTLMGLEEDQTGSGFTFGEYSIGSLRDNDLQRFNLCVEVWSSQSVTIEENRMTMCGDGITFQTGSSGLAKENQIYGNYCGIFIGPNSTPTIEGNNIYENQVGLRTNPSTTATILDNVIENNVLNTETY